ncbi:MAG: Bacterial domain protein [Thermoleophilia bacterium]|nr:Bacterial domain protein [Thermoleophilia bacterium]
MTSLAAFPTIQTPQPMVATTVNTSWMDPAIVSPVTGPMTSPAAATTTTWVPQEQGRIGTPPSMLDAIANTLLAPSADSVAATQLLGMSPSVPALPVAAPVVPVVPVAAVAAPETTTTTVEAPPVAAAPPASVGTVLAGIASAAGTAVAEAVGAGTSRAKRVGSELWAGVSNPRSVHVSQVASKYNTAPAAGNKDCGPTSVVMALRLIGTPIPGATTGATPQRLINRIRQLSGNADNTAATTNFELERAITSAGAKAKELTGYSEIKASILAGKPVILNGNPGNAGAYGSKFSAAQMTPYDGAHWIVVSGFDEKLNKFIINDPLSKVGPVKVSPTQLEAYRAGSMGIEVSS